MYGTSHHRSASERALLSSSNYLSINRVSGAYIYHLESFALRLVSLSHLQGRDMDISVSDRSTERVSLTRLNLLKFYKRVLLTDAWMT